MIKIEKFQMKHLKGFNPRDIIADLEITMVENMLDGRKDIVSLIYKDEVICIAGINHLRIGAVEAWLIVSDSVNKCKLAFFKTIRGLIDFIFESMGIHRFEIAIDCRWQEGAKWAHALGLTFESIARAYDFNMLDHAIFTRIKD